MGTHKNLINPIKPDQTRSNHWYPSNFKRFLIMTRFRPLIVTIIIFRGKKNRQTRSEPIRTSSNPNQAVSTRSGLLFPRFVWIEPVETDERGPRKPGAGFPGGLQNPTRTFRPSNPIQPVAPYHLKRERNPTAAP